MRAEMAIHEKLRAIASQGAEDPRDLQGLDRENRPSASALDGRKAIEVELVGGGMSSSAALARCG
jgi:hypothetical protein